MAFDTEEKIRSIGGILYQAREERPSVFNSRHWMGRMMEWTMRDEAFKLALLRFVDVLPSLKTDAAVVRLLLEYFSDTPAPPLIRRALERSSRGVLPHILARVMRTGVGSFAREFIAGRSHADAAAALASLWNEGAAASVDLLGEAVLSDAEARATGTRYLELMEGLAARAASWPANSLLEQGPAGAIPRLDLSLKISSFSCRFDPMDWDGAIESAGEGLRPIFEAAQRLGLSLTFDMEQSYIKDLTIAVFKDMLDEFSALTDASIALQTYHRDTRADILDLISWARERKRRVGIRLVKGAYWDYESVTNRRKGWPVPVFLTKEETDASFEELTRLLLEHSEFIRPVIASHNIRSISSVIAWAEALGLPNNAFEFQMLYGMGVPIRKALQKMGYRVRVYTPVGELIPGMAYLVRRIIENTANESFLRRFFTEQPPFDVVIQPPKVYSRPEPEPAPGGFSNEPLTDFSRKENRDLMRSALASGRNDTEETVPLIIGHKEIVTEDRRTSFNPARPEEVLATVSYASRREAVDAIADARGSWAGWRDLPPEDRAEYLFKTAALLRKERFELAALEISETGKPWHEADADVCEAIDYLEYYGREMMRLTRREAVFSLPGEKNEYTYAPKGVGVVIAPWNFPLAIPAGMVSAAIVTGNCVIFKPSGLSPLCGLRLVQAFREAGLPPGVLQFLPCDGHEVGEFMTVHPDVDFVVFTGSRDVGIRIVRRAAGTEPAQRNVKKVVAEMGGKNAIIVDETADLDEAVRGVIESAFGYQGQKCSACSRVIVAAEIFEEFTMRLGAAAESIRIGDPALPSSFMGPVIDRHAAEKIRRYAGIARTTASTLFFRDGAGSGHFISPSVFTDLPSDSPVLHDEIFGPVLAVMRSTDIDDAIRMANDTSYALTGGIYSRSPENIRKGKAALRAGNLYINRKITGAIVGRQPFGGFGMSGVGSKAGGPDYLVQFTNPVSISEETLRKGYAPS